MSKEISKMKVSFDLNGLGKIKWFEHDKILYISDSDSDLFFDFHILRNPYVHKSFLEELEIIKCNDGNVIPDEFIHIGSANFIYEYVDEMGNTNWNYNPRHFFIKGEQ